MSFFGVLLFSFILFFYACIFLSHDIQNLLQKLGAKHGTESKLIKFSNKLEVFHHSTFRAYAGYTALLFALWNLFAPDFGSVLGGFTLVGALIPVTMLFIDAFILVPSLFDFIPSEKIKTHLDTVLQKATPIAGWLTLACGIAHLLLFRLPLF